MGNRFKNILNPTNQDSIELSSSFSLTGDFYIEILMDIKSEDNFHIPLGYSVDLNSKNYINTYATGRLQIVFDDSQNINFSTVDTVPRTGLYLLKIEKEGLDIKVYVDGELKDTNTLSSDTSLKIDTIGSSFSGVYFDATICYVDINGEVFNLNEKSGLEVYGDKGTVGTRLTSHADGLTYINDEVIQNVPEFKNRLMDSNQDYISIPPYTINNLSDVKVKLHVKYDSDGASAYPLFTWGENTSLDRIRIHENVGQIYCTLYKNGAYYDAVNVARPLGVKEYIIELNNLEVYINGDLVKTFADTSFSGINSQVTLPSFGKYLGGVYTTMSVYKVSLNNEMFNFNEKSGTEVYGDKGTVGTRYTSHADGLTYINSEMITVVDQFANKLEKANVDYLSFDSAFDFTDGKTIELIASAQSSFSFLFGNSSNLNYFILFNTTSIQVRGSSGVSKTFSTSLDLNKYYHYRFERNGDDLSLYVDGQFVATHALSVGELIQFDQLGLRGFSGAEAADLSVLRYSLDNEIYSLSEKSGARVYGNKGGKATRQTSHADGLSYINSDVIRENYDY